MSRCVESNGIRRSAGIALAIGVLFATGACAHIPSRVWYNGQAMSQTWQYQSLTSGEWNPRLIRDVYYSADARRIGQPTPRPYAPFGRW